MARPIRIEFAGALYHITSRGNRREDIYHSDNDRIIFLSILDSVCKRFNWFCHAFCLMDNHYHLLIETPQANLSQGMRLLNGVYTQKINRIYSRVGHVFQGRYKSILVERDSHLLELSRYIVLNPVRAKMVLNADEWVWSSYLATAGRAFKPDCLSIDWLLAQFSEDRAIAIIKYEQFVEEIHSSCSPWKELKNQIYLGSAEFVNKMQSNIDPAEDLSEIPSPQYTPLVQPLSDYEKQSFSRNEGIKLAYASGGYSMKEIGDYFGIHYSRVSRIVRDSSS